MWCFSYVHIIITAAVENSFNMAPMMRQARGGGEQACQFSVFLAAGIISDAVNPSKQKVSLLLLLLLLAQHSSTLEEEARCSSLTFSSILSKAATLLLVSKLPIISWICLLVLALADRAFRVSFLLLASASLPSRTLKH
jgi:Na+/citrate or Na+/malate symporter